MDVLIYHSNALTEKLESLVGEELDVFYYIFRCTLDIIYGRIKKFLNVYKIYIHSYGYNNFVTFFIVRWYA